MEETQQNTTNFASVPQPIVIVQRRNGAGVAGFVLALLGMILCWVPVVNFILWLLGIIFSAVGLRRAPRGMAITGMIFSLIGLILFLVFTFTMFLGNIFVDPWRP